MSVLKLICLANAEVETDPPPARPPDEPEEPPPYAIGEECPGVFGLGVHPPPPDGGPI